MNSALITTTPKQPLTLLHTSGPAGNPSNLWVSNPVKLSPPQQATLQMDQLIPILQEAERSPSTLAAIPSDQIVSPVIHQIDAAYRAALVNYKNLLASAETGDLREIQALNGVKIWEQTSFAWLKWLFGTHIISETDYLRDTQAHRYAWLMKLDTLEEGRLQGINKVIKSAIQPLVTHLRELELKNQTDEAAKDKLWQLKRIYELHFPADPLKDKKDIDKWLPKDDIMEAKFAKASKLGVKLLA